MAKSELMAKLLEDHKAKIDEVNKVCLEGTATELDGKLTELANIEKEYRHYRECEVFAGLGDAHEAIERHHFETIGHKKLTNEGRMVGVEKTTKTVQIDLKKLCEKKGWDLDWFYEMQVLNKRLTLKVAEGLGVSASGMKEIDNSYYMNSLACQIELGKTPTSNTQIVKHMQKVLDLLSPGEGRIENRDLNFVLYAYAKRNNKDSLRLQCSKHSMLQSLLTDVFYRIATKKTYGLDYKRGDITDKPVEEKVSESKTIVTPKAEAAA